MTEALVLTFLCTLYHVFWAIIYFEEKNLYFNSDFNSDLFQFRFFSLPFFFSGIEQRKYFQTTKNSFKLLREELFSPRKRAITFWSRCFLFVWNTLLHKSFADWVKNRFPTQIRATTKFQVDNSGKTEKLRKQTSLGNQSLSILNIKTNISFYCLFPKPFKNPSVNLFLGMINSCRKKNKDTQPKRAKAVHLVKGPGENFSKYLKKFI